MAARYDELRALIPPDFGLEVSIPTPAQFIITREQNAGYASFDNDTQIVSGISNIFPVFFFLVAILICITTMSRMVEEERTQIGTMKAMGYAQMAIMKKYLLYAASAAIWGWVVGFFLGTWGIPKVLWLAYGSLYRMTDLYYIFSPSLAIGTLAASLFCSLSAVIMSAHKEFSSTPAETMRPKVPKQGKHILLERLPALWNRLSFITKVSIRNVFRYKKRLLMMVLGVSGCTALLVAGFGIRDSVQDVANYQYGEIVQYDLFVVIYNLTNINILERTREIATIGVLGFTPKEMAAYVLRENLILSGVGGLIGLVLGKLLHGLIMSMIVVTGIAFDIRISLFSYVISFALTLAFGMTVNLVMRRKLQKIPMAESLKSVE